MILVFVLCGIAAFFSGLYVVDAHIRNRQKTAINKFQQKFGEAIADGIFKSVTEDPKRPLTEAGFRWACYIALSRYWPDTMPEEASRWLMEYCDVPFGSDGYDWTFVGAQNLAREYVIDFGEECA